MKFHLKAEEKILRAFRLKREYLNLKKTIEAEESELLGGLLQAINAEFTNDFPAELKLCTYQLTRLEYNEIVDEGADLIEPLTVIINKFSESDNLEEIEEVSDKYKKLVTKFIQNCMIITAV